MARVYVSIGSNVERTAHVRAGVAELRDRYGELALSDVYESAAVGFAGDDFYNLVAGFDSDEAPLEIVRALRDIEDRHGRVRGGERFSARTLDIDLLLYDELVLKSPALVLPRAEITRHAFVLGPLAQLAGDLVDPASGRTYKELWTAFDRASQPMRRVEFAWNVSRQ